MKLGQSARSIQSFLSIPFIIISFFFVSPFGHTMAQDFRHMISTENSLMNAGFYMIGNYNNKEKDDKYVYLSSSYSYSLSSQLFLKIRPKYRNYNYSEGNSFTSYGSEIGFVYNFLSQDIKVTKSLYVSAMLGAGKIKREDITNFYNSSTGPKYSVNSTTKRNYHSLSLELGHRFPLASNVSYSPSVGYFKGKVKGLPSEREKTINFLKFDFFL